MGVDWDVHRADNIPHLGEASTSKGTAARGAHQGSEPPRRRPRHVQIEQPVHARCGAHPAAPPRLPKCGGWRAPPPERPTACTSSRSPKSLTFQTSNHCRHVLGELAHLRIGAWGKTPSGTTGRRRQGSGGVSRDSWPVKLQSCLHYPLGP